MSHPKPVLVPLSPEFTEKRWLRIAERLTMMKNRHTDYVGHDICHNNSIFFEATNHQLYYAIRFNLATNTSNIEIYNGQRLLASTSFFAVFLEINTFPIVSRIKTTSTGIVINNIITLQHFVTLNSSWMKCLNPELDPSNTPTSQSIIFIP